jgi:SAM-dependent methyltransferase
LTTPSYRDYRSEIDRTYGAFGDHDYFQQIKADALVRILNEFNGDGRPLRILDLGAGVGTMLSALPSEHLRVGVEPDRQMLDQIGGGARTFDVVGALGTSLPFVDDSFDVVYMANVLHHVEPPELLPLLRECRRALRPGGLIVVFEHNGYNLPIIFFLKAFVKIDKDAHFFTPAALKRLLISAGLKPESPRYLCFLPKFLRAFVFLERYMGWLPLGGQFYIVCCR